MKTRKKIIVFAFFAIIGIAFLGCNKGKIAEYEKTIETLNSQIALLQEENDNLKTENTDLIKDIEAYKLTEQYFYQSGADEFLNYNYLEAIIWLGKLKVKFPTSPLLRNADKIIEDAKIQMYKKDFTPIIYRKKGSNTSLVRYINIPGVGDIPKRDVGEREEKKDGTVTYYDQHGKILENGISTDVLGPDGYYGLIVLPPGAKPLRNYGNHDLTIINNAEKQ